MKRDAWENGPPLQIPWMPAVATLLAHLNTEQMMLEIIHDRTATGVTTVV
jgi:hypothetical protein